jgi:Icc-related predicted phosphoesterase
MKIAYASDLHLEFGAINPEQLITDADYLFLAGDIAEARSFGKSMLTDSGDYKEWDEKLTKLFTVLSAHYKKVFLTLGNHEYYHSRIGKAETIINKFCSQFNNVFMLQDKCVDLEGYTLYGSTMWTDMGFHKKDPLIEFKLSMRMNDFRLVTYQSPKGYRKFKPQDAALLHSRYLKSLQKYQPDVILQHHAPAEGSVPERFKNHELNPAYYSETLEDMLIDVIHPKLIVHGHIHGKHDYEWGSTRVVGNSRGYVGMENTDDFKVKVVEL